MNLNALLYLCLMAFNHYQWTAPVAAPCWSTEEQKLFGLINEYRAKNRLPAISASASLTIVAQTHVQDLEKNQPATGKCNLHSWSDKGTWKACCYTPDHKNAALMWSKPAELTNYPSDGFEIAYWHSDAATAAEALNGWKTSAGHNALLINKNIWKDKKWKAMGIGIYQHYAVVWFGLETDPLGKPEFCK
jgi:uncharacterized protein YkwD